MYVRTRPHQTEGVSSCTNTQTRKTFPYMAALKAPPTPPKKGIHYVQTGAGLQRSRRVRTQRIHLKCEAADPLECETCVSKHDRVSEPNAST